MKRDQIHIGNMIASFIKSNGISKSELGRRIPCCRTHVYEILNSPSLHSQQIQRISEVLDHDFFADLSEKMKEV